MRKLLFATAIALAAVGCDKKKTADDHAETAPKLPEMTVDAVAAALDAKQLTPVDCNGETVRKNNGIIPGAILIADENTFPASVLPADKTTKLLFYCGGPG